MKQHKRIVLKQTARGFTLVELVITMVIAGIIVMIAAPSFTSYISEQNLALDVDDLSRTIAEARFQAVTARRDVTVNLNQSGTNTSLQVYWQPKSQSVFKSATTVSGSVVTAITFSLTGKLKNANSIQINLCDQKSFKAKGITIDYMGNIQTGATSSCS